MVSEEEKTKKCICCGKIFTYDEYFKKLKTDWEIKFASRNFAKRKYCENCKNLTYAEKQVKKAKLLGKLNNTIEPIVKEKSFNTDFLKMTIPIEIHTVIDKDVKKISCSINGIEEVFSKEEKTVEVVETKEHVKNVIEKTKKCSNCEKTKSVSEFYKDNSRKDGLCRTCKECDREYQKKRILKNKIKKSFKQCVTCGKTKPISEFNKDKSTKDKHRHKCKQCDREYQKALYYKNKEKQETKQEVKQPESYKKTCSYCGKTKTEDEFHKNSQNKDGLQSWCKECIKKFQQKNAEKKIVFERKQQNKNNHVHTNGDKHFLSKDKLVSLLSTSNSKIQYKEK